MGWMAFHWSKRRLSITKKNVDVSFETCGNTLNYTVDCSDVGSCYSDSEGETESWKIQLVPVPGNGYNIGDKIPVKVPFYIYTTDNSMAIYSNGNPCPNSSQGNNTDPLIALEFQDASPIIYECSNGGTATCNNGCYSCSFIDI